MVLLGFSYHLISQSCPVSNPCLSHQLSSTVTRDLLKDALPTELQRRGFFKLVEKMVERVWKMLRFVKVSFSCTGVGSPLPGCHLTINIVYRIFDRWNTEKNKILLVKQYSLKLQLCISFFSVEVPTIAVPWNAIIFISLLGIGLLSSETILIENIERYVMVFFARFSNHNFFRFSTKRNKKRKKEDIYCIGLGLLSNFQIFFVVPRSSVSDLESKLD